VNPGKFRLPIAEKFDFEHGRAWSSLSLVRLFRTVLTVALVALWPLVTGHCRLEQLPGFAFLQCGEAESTASHEDADCDTDGCAVVESGSYKTEDRTVCPPGPDLIVVATFYPEPEPPPRSGFADFFTVAAPEFPVTWQFCLRTALPPRAPSAVS